MHCACATLHAAAQPKPLPPSASAPCMRLVQPSSKHERLRLACLVVLLAPPLAMRRDMADCRLSSRCAVWLALLVVPSVVELVAGPPSLRLAMGGATESESRERRERVTTKNVCSRSSGIERGAAVNGKIKKDLCPYMVPIYGGLNACGRAHSSQSPHSTHAAHAPRQRSSLLRIRMFSPLPLPLFFPFAERPAPSAACLCLDTAAGRYHNNSGHLPPPYGPLMPSCSSSAVLEQVGSRIASRYSPTLLPLLFLAYSPLLFTTASGLRLPTSLALRLLPLPLFTNQRRPMRSQLLP